MLCQFERIIYPRDTRSIGADSFMIVSYKPCETIKDSSGNKIAHVKAVGYCLPTAEGLCFNLHGHWSKSDKHGLQFEVERYEEIIIPNKENIIAYLSSGQIKYIGPAMAQKIYDAFGDQTLEILDKEPEKLLSIKGISTKRLEVICESYTANRAARDVIAFLTPYGITPNRAVQLFKEYRDKTITTVRTNPYKLSDLDGVGFITADKIAKNLGVHPLSTDRVDSGILHTLQQAENMGHLCINFIRKQAVQHPESSLDELIERGFQWEDPTAQVMLESIGDEFPMECEALAISYRELPPKRQEMLKLLFVDEMPPAEVAERMNCTVQHVYNRHSQALKALKAALGEGGGDL